MINIIIVSLQLILLLVLITLTIIMTTQFLENKISEMNYEYTNLVESESIENWLTMEVAKDTNALIRKKWRINKL